MVPARAASSWSWRLRVKNETHVEHTVCKSAGTFRKLCHSPCFPQRQISRVDRVSRAGRHFHVHSVVSRRASKWAVALLLSQSFPFWPWSERGLSGLLWRGLTPKFPECFAPPQKPNFDVCCLFLECSRKLLLRLNPLKPFSGHGGPRAWQSWVFITGGCSGRGVQWMAVVLYNKLVYHII